VVRPCLEPETGPRRLELGPRLRADARVSHAVGAQRRAQGRPPQWGARVAAPPHQVYGPVTWQASRAWGDGRGRRFQDTPLRCRWAVSGPQLPGPAFVVPRAGDATPWLLVATALDLSAPQVVTVWAARFRQEDGCRDHTHRLGMEECRAWTTEPILRTCQLPLVALTRLRLLQARWTHAWGQSSWWLTPAWNPRQGQAAILDLRRLFWRYRAAFAQVLLTLETLKNLPGTAGPCHSPPGKAA